MRPRGLKVDRRCTQARATLAYDGGLVELTLVELRRRLALGANVSVLSAAEAVATAYQRNDTVPYCLVKLLGKPAIHIWVGLPLGGLYNGRLPVPRGRGAPGSAKHA